MLELELDREKVFSMGLLSARPLVWELASEWEDTSGAVKECKWVHLTEHELGLWSVID